MTDILGPADAANSTASRPVDGRTFSSLDSWFKDCTAPTSDDGTEIQAAFLNGGLAAWRALWRANGGTIADPTVKIVPEIGTDDNGLIKAVQHLIQRGQVLYAVDSGTVNAVVVTLSPAPPEYKAGMTLRVKLAASNTAAVTINVNGLGLRNVTSTYLGVVQANSMPAGMVAELVYDGTQFQLVGALPNLLTAPRTYYVNGATGNDNNNGLASGTAFATIQRALAVNASFNQNGFDVTINVADGSYIGPFNCPQINGQGRIFITGNIATPANVACTSNTGSLWAVTGGPYFISGFKSTVTGTIGGDPGNGVNCAANGIANIGAMTFGAAVAAHMGGSGQINVNGPIVIAGGGQYHMNPTVRGSINLNPAAPPALTISAAVTFSVAFVGADNLSVLYGTYASITNPGNVTGAKYLASSGSIVNSNGAGVNYFPGTIAGSIGTGGQYL